MHFSVFVAAEGTPVDASIEAELAPFEGEHWDWFQIGGRWTGHFDGYDPTKDPALQETCSCCDGTGMRNDELGRAQRAKDPSYTCNDCHGLGKRTKWPTDWPTRPGDVAKPEVVAAGIREGKIDLPYAYVDVGSEAAWCAHETYHPEAQDLAAKFQSVPTFQDDVLAWLDRVGKLGRSVVIVDCHN